jgi:hypothetical protein
MISRERPPILKSTNEFSEFVKGFIIDKNGELVGLVLSRGNLSFIQFLVGKKEKKMIVTPLIVWDKEKREVDIDAEVFYNSPKEFLNKIYKKMMMKNGSI